MDIIGIWAAAVVLAAAAAAVAIDASRGVGEELAAHLMSGQDGL